MNWHYVDQGRNTGPVTDAQLVELFRNGTITADTLVWHEGLPDWIRLHDAKLEMNSPPSAAPPPLAPEAAPKVGEVVCAECGRVFPTAETIRYGKAHVCAACKPVFLQKLSEGALVNTGELNYAGFGIRFGAKFVDGFILGLPLIVIFGTLIMPVISEANQAGRNHQPVPEHLHHLQIMWMLANFGFLFVRVAYDTFFLGKFGATPGKMLCKIKVVMPDGSPFTYGRAAGRALAEIVSGMACYIGYLIVLFDAQKRALHDHICNTRVIHKQ